MHKEKAELLEKELAREGREREWSRVNEGGGGGEGGVENEYLPSVVAAIRSMASIAAISCSRASSLKSQLMKEKNRILAGNKRDRKANLMTTSSTT